MKKIIQWIKDVFNLGNIRRMLDTALEELAHVNEVLLALSEQLNEVIRQRDAYAEQLAELREQFEKMRNDK